MKHGPPGLEVPVKYVVVVLLDVFQVVTYVVVVLLEVDVDLVVFQVVTYVVVVVLVVLK